MATSRKTPAKGSTPKATPAGRKGRTSPTRKSSRAKAAPEAAPEAAVETAAAAPAPEAPRAHLRAVTDSDMEPAAAPAAGGEDGRFKRTDLIEAVADRTSLKRSDARIVLDLVLQELGRALDRNEELVLPPLGKLMVKKRKPDADGPDILTVKIRRPAAGADAAGEGGESPLADPDEDG